MQFLANENFPLDAVTALRDKGYDVVWIRTDAPGSKDPEILQRAVSENRVLLTFDKDFGELAFQFGLPASCWIVLFRLQASTSAILAGMVVAAMQSRIDWAGRFSLVDLAVFVLGPCPRRRLHSGRK